MKIIRTSTEEASPVHRPTETDLQNSLGEMIFGALLETDGGADADTNLFEAGLDSMAIMHLLISIEEKFHLQIPPEEVTNYNFQSIRSLALLLERLVPAPSDKSN